MTDFYPRLSFFFIAVLAFFVLAISLTIPHSARAAYPVGSCTIAANPLTYVQPGSSTLTWTVSNALNAAGISPTNLSITPPAQTSQIVEADCSSLSYTYQECPLYVPIASVQSIEVVTIYSYCSHMCPYDSTPYPSGPNQNYGIKNGNVLWVNQGFRAHFKVTYLPTLTFSGTTVVTPSGTTPYSINVTGPIGSGSCQATVTVLPPLGGSCAPTPTSGPLSQTFNWGSTVTGGTGYYTYSWTGADGMTGSGPGVSMVYPSAGTKTATLVVTDIGYPVPTASLTPASSSISPGGSVTLTHTCTNSTSASINQGIGTVTPANGTGTRTVSPAASTTYTLSCTGPGETVTASATVLISGSGGGGGGGCFAPETLVTMADGSFKPIAEVVVGDRVLGEDEMGNRRENTVTHLLVHEGSYETLTLNNSLIVTPNHPMRVLYGGIIPVWVPAGELHVGDILAGTNGAVPIVSIEPSATLPTVHNLEVVPSHTYFVDGVLVHNALENIAMLSTNKVLVPPSQNFALVLMQPIQNLAAAWLSNIFRN